MDDTHSNQSSQKIGWSRELLYQLIESVNDYAVLATDLDGQIVSWNVGAEKIFGYTAKEVIGQDCAILFTREDRADNEPERERACCLNKGCLYGERWHLRRDESLFFASLMQMPLYDKTGGQIGYAKIARDLTERVALQKALREAHVEVEIKVEKRTSELHESVAALRTEVRERAESEELRAALLHKIVRAQEDERKRISRDIHDHIGQQVIGLKLQLQAFQEEVKENSRLKDKITAVRTLVEQIDAEVDFLAWELRPSVIDELGLVAAIKSYLREWSGRFQIPAEFEQTGFDQLRLLPETEINLYRICQETLNNICKHAQANNVAIQLIHQDGTIVLIIEDDGKGFDTSQKTVVTDDDRGLGLLGMKERAELIGGGIEIESAIGHGTTIYVRVPALFNGEIT